MGVFFNDSTKIVMIPETGKFDYIERSNDKSESSKTYSLTNYPKDLSKKVTLFEHFKSYLNNCQVQTYKQSYHTDQIV